MIGVIDKGSHNPYPVAATGFLFGSVTTFWLFGIHVAQVARYYHRFGKEDRKRYRYALVPVVFGLSLVHISMILAALWHYFVFGILEPRVWGSFYWSLSAQDLLIPTVSFVSHCFFGYRVCSLAGAKRTWWHLYTVFAFLTFLTGIAFGICARLWSQDPWMPYDQFLRLSVGPVANSLPTAWLSCAALIDGGLTASLVYLLLREKSAYTHTRRLLAKVAQLTLETVLLTHLIGATLFILWLVSRTRSNAFWFLIEIISEMYALSILFTLNSRQVLRKAARPDSQIMMDRQLHILSNNNSASSQQAQTSLPHWRHNARSDSAIPSSVAGPRTTPIAASLVDLRTHGTSTPVSGGPSQAASGHTLLEALMDTEREPDSGANTPWSEKSIRWIPNLGSRLRRTSNHLQPGLRNSDSTETSSVSSDKADKNGQSV